MPPDAWLEIRKFHADFLFFIYGHFEPCSFMSSFVHTFIDPQDRAYEESQKYKEGKFILERALLVDVQ